MEDIPNKVRDILGIIMDVILLTEDGKDYIEICVNPSSYPVNYKGEYHYRSGSTKQLLRGAALTEFLLSKIGYKWDAVPVDGSPLIQADMKAMISYDNVTRIETYPLSKAAVREAVYISNDCVFSVGWTVETLMERHRSQPYNPNIANGFFRAGYVETWGRGIEKICEACKKHGVPMPEYTLHLEDIMVKFTPLMDVKVPKVQNGTLDGTLNGTLEEKILFVIKKNSHITQSQIAPMLYCSERKIKCLMKMMQEDGMIERVGGRRLGQWIVK